ncbi:MAG TPA: hypothetical protein VGR28_09800 [Candidatus Thermoplasmatota archaeon]|jgi:methionine-rich copper-binding protein CopC|nr:hypothetical protein [Candidatus Thermoplasmatota archaeon]
MPHPALATAVPLLLALTLGAPPAAALEEGFSIELARDAAAASAGGEDVALELVREVRGEEAVFSITTARTQVHGAILVRGWDVARAEQVYVEVDPHFDLKERPADDLDSAGEGVRIFNYTSGLPNLTIDLTFPVDGNATLVIVRDVQPPNFTIGAPANVTDHSFDLVTSTDEYAAADLVIRPAAGGEEVHSPIGVRSLQQAFPVIGLRPATLYSWYVDFRDGSGNTARSPNATLRTLPTPARPAPVITAREPPPNATVDAAVRLVAVNFTGPAPASLDGVSVFLDKVPQHQGVALLPGRLEVRPAAPLGPGLHTVGVELTSADGGMTVDQWAFHVAGARADAAAPGPGLALLVAGLAGAAWAAARRRSP